MLLMIIFFLTYVTLPRPLQSRPVPSRMKMNESLLKARETLNFEFVCWTNEVVKYLSRVRNKTFSFLHFLSVFYTGGTTWILTTAKSYFTSPSVMLSWDRWELIENNRLLCSLEWLIWTVRGKQRSMKHETCSQELPQKNCSFHSTIALWMVLPYRCSIAVLFPAL